MADAGLRNVVVLVPKVESARDINLVAQALGTEHGLHFCDLIQTPWALQRLAEIWPPGPLASCCTGCPT